MQPIEVSMPPAIFKSHSGILYGIAGNVWVEVPEGTTLADLSQYMVHKPREIISDAGEKTWSVKGSKGNLYSVRLTEGVYTCSCPGFGWRRKCKHVEAQKNESR